MLTVKAKHATMVLCVRDAEGTEEAQELDRSGRVKQTQTQPTMVSVGLFLYSLFKKCLNVLFYFASFLCWVMTQHPFLSPVTEESGEESTTSEISSSSSFYHPSSPLTNTEASLSMVPMLI